MASLWEGLIVSRETKRGSRQYGGIRQKRSLGWLENPDEGTPHKSAAAGKTSDWTRKKQNQCREREKGAEKKEERRKRSKEGSRVVGRPTEGERKVEVEVEARWR